MTDPEKRRLLDQVNELNRQHSQVRKQLDKTKRTLREIEDDYEHEKTRARRYRDERNTAESRLDNTEAKLSSTKSRLESSQSELTTAESTIRSQNVKLDAHLGFRRKLRQRCLIIHSRDRLGHHLTPEREDIVTEANRLVHGGDSLFDATHVATEESHSYEYTRDYQDLYMIHPATIFKYKSNKRLVQVTDWIGHITLDDCLSGDEINEFRDAAEDLQRAHVVFEETGRRTYPLSTGLELEEQYDELIASSRARRRPRGKRTPQRTQRAICG